MPEMRLACTLQASMEVSMALLHQAFEAVDMAEGLHHAVDIIEEPRVRCSMFRRYNGHHELSETCWKGIQRFVWIMRVTMCADLLPQHAKET